VRYALQGSGGILGPWTTVTITKLRKVTISGLTMAGIYQFQIRALGLLGYTDWMDTEIFVVAEQRLRRNEKATRGHRHFGTLVAF
jgi:hypothetical protein